MSETSQTTTAPAEIVELVQRFRDQQSAYRAGKYNETQLRRDFLDPLFEALGWDVSNRKNYSEKYREVVYELSVEIEGQAKAADYAFQTGGAIHFLLEAKKPAVNIETNPEPAFQIRRYGWSAKVPVGVLSDFEQLAVYDCRTRPVHGDPAHKDRARLFHFSEYVEKWAELHQLLSHQAVHQGSLDQFIQAQKGKRGTADVDDAFLLEMERWREELARNIALRNPGLSQYELNSAVQTTIDRLIFLRICEDRGIEPENALREATDGKEVYSDLLELFRRADRKYNSGLFHFEEEKGQPSYPDRLTPTIKIDDRVLKDILANLYYPRSPYAFKYIPADILGQVYERFLGKVIRLTAGHQARVEEKPEVRKAGGVYYTPTYIVDYIVKNTLGELLKTRDPESLAENPLRVLDPACGSGSFLLGAYQYLLDWHLDWYSANDPARWARGKTPPVYESRGGWALSMEKKKEILTRHIFGVDIDPQAVEVTKLSLLLKVVENPGQLSLLGERILPDLGRNIQCGNSLIGPDYYEGRQLAMFDSEEQRRVNAFDWRSAFPQVFAAGGFDAVIGNPPYVRGRSLEEELKTYYIEKYTWFDPNSDLYITFLEKAYLLAKINGYFSFIIPRSFLTEGYAKSIRKGLLQACQPLEIVDFKGIKVFEEATVTNVITTFIKGNIKNVFPIRHWKDEEPVYLSTLQVLAFQDISIRPELSGVKNQIVEKINAVSNMSLGDLCYVSYSVAAHSEVEKKKKDAYIFNMKIDEKCQPFIEAREIGRYKINYLGRWLQYDPRIVRRPSLPELFVSPKIMVRDVVGERGLICALDTTGLYADYSVVCLTLNHYLRDVKTRRLDWSFEQLEISKCYSLEFILGLLNSTLLNFIFKTSIGGGLHVYPNNLRQLPIPRITPGNPKEEEMKVRLEELIKGILKLKKIESSEQMPTDRERLQRQIEAADRQIDRLVYELYGLSEDEIRVVEGG